MDFLYDNVNSVPNINKKGEARMKKMSMGLKISLVIILVATVFAARLRAQCDPHPITAFVIVVALGLVMVAMVVVADKQDRLEDAAREAPDEFFAKQ